MLEERSVDLSPRYDGHGQTPAHGRVHVALAVALAHAVLAFVFNVAILALAVNLIVGRLY